MFSKSFFRFVFSALIAFSLVACGGGGGGGGTSNDAATLSAGQAAFESFYLAPNQAYKMAWLLPNSGMPVVGTSYLASTFTEMSSSPLTNGTQTTTTAPYVSLSPNLPIPSTALKPSRYLINGNIVLGSFPGINQNSYVGGNVQDNAMSADGLTVLESVLRTNISSVPLSGTVASAPTEFAQFFNALYFNPSLLSSSAVWASNAAYLKYTQTEINDSYTVGDFGGVATTGTSPTPVATGTTLANLMGTGGITTVDNGTSAIYSLSNGTVSIINGVNTYAANSPMVKSTTEEYRIFFELNGNVYQGVWIKAGTVLGGPTHEVGTPSSYTIDYSSHTQIRLNQAAVDSLKSAITQVYVIAGSATTNTNPVDGTGTAAVFWGGGHLVLDGSGNIIVSDLGVLRKVTQLGVVTTLVPNVSNWTNELTIDSVGNFYGSSNQISTATTPATWEASLQELTTSGSLNNIAINWETSTTNPSVGSGGIAIDSTGNLYQTDSANNQILKFTQAGVMTVFAGSGTSGETDGIGTAATFTNPQDLAIDNSGNIFVLDLPANGVNGVIRKITANGTVSTISTQNNSVGASAIAVDQSDNIYVAGPFAQISRIDGSGNFTLLQTGLTTFITGLTADGSGNIYAMTRGSGAQILKITF